MIKKIVHRLLRHRHFWREVEFDELSEIYITMMFRSLALSLTNIFVPLYMLRLGYGIADVIMLVLSYFTARALIFDLLAGWLITKIGAKHTIFCSSLLLIGSTSMFLTLPHIAWPLWFLGGIWGGTSSLFAIPFHVDFSKIKHKAHGGKELGYVSIMEKLGAILGPVIGGIVATLFGGQYIFLVAMAMLLIGGLPLLRTAEPFRPHQALNFSTLKLGPIKRDIYSFMAYGVELTMCGTVWPLYLGLFVLTTGGAYAKLGFLASISVIAAVITAYVIGKLIDNHHGRQLMRVSAVANAALYVFRPFVSIYPLALLINIMNEGLTVGYHMPYTKGMYDRGDELARHRVAYFVTMELTSSIAKASTWFFLLILTMLFDDRTVTAAGFAIGGAASLLILTERFKALNPPKR